MSRTLAFQARWLAAIDAWRSGEAPDTDIAEAFEPGFAVYANTGLQACIAALEANFPSVAHRLGPERFRALAGDHARRHPPRDARLMLYGDAFPDHLRERRPDTEYPDLHELACLDRLWTQAHAAADAPALNFARWARQDPDRIAAARLAPAPATRWRRHATLPIWDLWSSARAADAKRPPPLARAQAVLITRPGDEVLACEVDEGACAFLDACASGLTLAEAAAQAAAGSDLQTLLATLFSQGAFADHASYPPALPTS